MAQAHHVSKRLGVKSSPAATARNTKAVLREWPEFSTPRSSWLVGRYVSASSRMSVGFISSTARKTAADDTLEALSMRGTMLLTSPSAVVLPHSGTALVRASRGVFLAAANACVWTIHNA